MQRRNAAICGPVYPLPYNNVQVVWVEVFSGVVCWRSSAKLEVSV